MDGSQLQGGAAANLHGGAIDNAIARDSPAVLKAMVGESNRFSLFDWLHRANMHL